MFIDKKTNQITTTNATVTVTATLIKIMKKRGRKEGRERYRRKNYNSHLTQQINVHIMRCSFQDTHLHISENMEIGQKSR